MSMKEDHMSRVRRTILWMKGSTPWMFWQYQDLEAAKQKLFDARIEYENAKRAWERLGQEEDGASEEAPSGAASAAHAAGKVELW